MKIYHVKLINIRSIEELEIDFTNNQSLIITGDNGTGKSTILRCIAMGITDQDSAASVLRELSGDLVGKKADVAKIIVKMKDKNGEYRITTSIHSLKVFEKVQQTIEEFKKGSFIEVSQEKFPWGKIFTAGYGAGIRNLGTADYQHYVPIDALYPLFKYDSPLQNPELSMRRVIDKARDEGNKESKTGEKHAKEMENYLTETLREILNLDNDEKVILSPTSIEVKSKKWGKHELSVLGDGYVSTITWILDLYSWWLLFLKLNKRRIIKNKSLNGIVIIDEIERHLHPIWQIRIMSLLQSAFPNVQFIITTHSPLIISGPQNIPVLILKESGTEIKIVSGWLSEDVYREVMGLESSRNLEIRETIDEFEKLQWKKYEGKASKKDLQKLNKLKLKITSNLSDDDPIVLTSKLQALSKTLRDNK